MSTNRSVGRITATQAKVRSASTPKKDRSTNLCAFTFADGRQCRTPRCSGHSYLCYFHAQKEAESLAAQQVGEDISRFLPVKLLTACDLGVAMSRLFCAVAQGQVKPKVATTLAYLAQTMLQSIPIAQHEYINCFDTNAWRSAVRVSFRSDDSKKTPAPETAPQAPASASPPSPVCHPERSEGSRPTPATRSAQPAPSPHTPLPPTSTEFAQQVLAGRHSLRSETPTPSGPGREPGSSSCSSSSASSSSSSNPSSTSSPPPQRPVNCHSERSEESAFSSSPVCHPERSEGSQPIPATQRSSVAHPARHEESASSSNPSLATHHSLTPGDAEGPLPHNPPPVPPGFGAPANWDVLIPPKPRRRFSRHWHLPE